MGLYDAPDRAAYWADHYYDRRCSGRCIDCVDCYECSDSPYRDEEDDEED